MRTSRLTCPVFFMAGRCYPPSLPGRRRLPQTSVPYLPFMLLLLALWSDPVSARPPASPFAARTATTTTGSPTGIDPQKRSANIWSSEHMYLWTNTRVLEILDDGKITSNTECTEYARMSVLPRVPGSENVSLAETRHPLGVTGDWYSGNARQNLVLTIRGVKSGLFACMNRRGKMYGAKKVDDECYFREEFSDDNSFNFYYSDKYSGDRPLPWNSKPWTPGVEAEPDKRWYIGLRRNRVMRGYNTKKDSQNVQFIPKSQIDVNKEKAPPPSYPNPTWPTENPIDPPPFTKPRAHSTRPTGPFEGIGRRRGRGGRKKKCNDMFVFPVLEGCGRKRVRGNRRTRERHKAGGGGGSSAVADRRRTKPRERHRQPAAA